MFQVERQEKIVQILEERPRVTVEELGSMAASRSFVADSLALVLPLLVP